MKARLFASAGTQDTQYVHRLGKEIRALTSINALAPESNEPPKSRGPQRPKGCLFRHQRVPLLQGVFGYAQMSYSGQ